MYGIIYKVTNIVNNKIYIGQTKNSLQYRINAHKCAALTSKSNSYFHKAIRKYGWDSFIWDIICECDTPEELNEKEIEFINSYGCHFTNGYGYNLTKGGDYNPMNDPTIKDRRDKKLLLSMKKYQGDNNVMKRVEVKDKHQLSINKISKDPKWIEAKRIGDEKQKSTYDITFPDGHHEIITGLNQFCKEHQLQQSKMSSVSSGSRPHHKGFGCVLLSKGV